MNWLYRAIIVLLFLIVLAAIGFFLFEIGGILHQGFTTGAEMLYGQEPF
jgi:hypothetical protein